MNPPQSVASLLWRQPLVKGLVIALAYCLSGKAGLLLAIPPGYATAIWPASGIALVAMLVAGNRYWPAILAGSFLTNVTVAPEGVVLTREVLTAIAIGCGASAQAVIGATLIKRFVGFPTLLANARDVFKFALLGGPLACLLAPTWGVSILTATHTIPLSAYTYSWWTWWIGDTIGVLIVTPLGVMWADRSGAWHSRRRVVTLSLLTTFVAAILVFLYASRSEWRSLEADFNDSAQSMTAALQRRVELHRENLISVANFFAASDHVDRAEFQRFSRSIVTARGDVMGIGWVPRVTSEKRAALEASLPASAKRPYFYEMFDPWPRSAARDETYPILYFLPRTHVDISGFDLASEPIRRAVLEQARDSGRLTASPRLEMTLAPGQPSDGFLLVQPIYAIENPTDIVARRRHLRGFAVEFFRLSEFVGHEDVTSSVQQGVRFSVDDVTSPESPVEMYKQASGVKDATRLDLQVDTLIDVGGRQWRLRAKPTLDYVTGHTTVVVWLVLAGGLLFSAMVGVGALILTGRTREIEALVDKRTDELAEINEKLSLEVCDHVRTEVALKEERSFLELILDNLSEGVVVFDPAGQMTVTNLGARRTLSRVSGQIDNPIQAVSRTALFQADGVTRLPTEDNPVARALRGETVIDHEIVAAARNRKPVTLMLTARPLFDASGTQNGALLFMRDVTESRAGERLKREFISVVSHELRTPITSIRGSLGLITGGAAGALPPKAQHLATIAYRNCERLSLLINDILDIDKIESGHLKLDMQVQPLAALVAQAVEANAGYARECDVTLELAAHSDESTLVNVDGHRLMQVLANLLSNAAKFSPRGAIVKVATEVIDGNVRVSVADRGPGIAAEFEARIFQKFSQADSSDHRLKHGTGLGLAISKALVEQMGGSINYATRMGEGTTFYFDLPIAQAHAKTG